MLIDTFTTLGRIFGAAADGDVHLDAPYDELAKNLGDLAAEYSVEPDGKHAHGSIAPIVRNGGFPELEDEAFALKPGELSQVIQVDASTFVILFCQEIVPARDVQLADVRDQIVSQLRKMREVTAASEFYGNVVSRSTVVDNITGRVVTPRQPGRESVLTATPDPTANLR